MQNDALVFDLAISRKTVEIAPKVTANLLKNEPKLRISDMRDEKHQQIHFRSFNSLKELDELLDRVLAFYCPPAEQTPAPETPEPAPKGKRKKAWRLHLRRLSITG